MTKSYFIKKIAKGSFAGIALFLSFQLIIPNALGKDNISLVSSNTNEVVLDFNTKSFTVENKVVDGVTYHTITIDQLENTRNSGMPQVPVKRIPIAIPHDATPVIEVIDDEMKVYSGYLLHPVPENMVIENGTHEKIEERFVLNTSVYGKDTLYPHELVAIESTGFMRSQRIAQLVIYPIQHNPVTGELRFHSKIHFKVKFNSNGCSASEKSTISKEKSGGPYENILKKILINYNPALKSSRNTLKRPRLDAISSDFGAVNELFPSIKISLNEEGIYQISYADLNKQELWEENFDQLDPRYLNLYNKGTETAIYISGEEDGIFDEGDYILFYGVPMTGVYTETNVYWLTVGDVEGLRMEEVSSPPPGSGDKTEYFETTYHGEEDRIIWNSRPGGLEKDRCFWKRFQRGSTDSITYVAGSNETQGVLLETITVQDSDNGLTANALVLIEPESYGEGCRLKLEPRTMIVNSGEEISFNVNISGDSCEEPSFIWTWWPLSSKIGSSIGEGVYTAGVNNTGGSVTEVVGVYDTANGYIYDYALVTVLPDEEDCRLYVKPSSSEPSLTIVQSGESITFTAESLGEGCDKSSHAWSPPTPLFNNAGSYIYYENVDIPITLNNVYPTEEDCQIRVLLMGKSTSEHRTQIYLNGDMIGDHSWSGQEESLFEVSLPQSSLNEGLNTVSLVPIYKTNTDYYYLDWIEIDYLDSYSAMNEDDEFAFPGEGEVIEIDGFTGDTVEIYDITDPYSVKRILDFLLEPTGEGDYLVKFQDPRAEELRYKALTSDKRKAPAGMVLDSPSDLSAEGKGADYIIITYDDFCGVIQPLADYRTSQGMKVETVKITDVYDEFNYGIFDPQAIKDFLTYAYESWDPAPVYVLLVGDANIDYKNIISTDRNYVPTQMYIDNYRVMGLSDNWFVCVSGDDIIPDLFMGRIPASNSSQVEYAINKIIVYEVGEYSEWHKRAVFAADDNYPEFQEVPDDLIENYFPQYFEKAKIYLKTIYDDVILARNDLIAYVSEGAMITHYSGHGQVDLWGSYRNPDTGVSGYLFKRRYVEDLTNTDKPTFMVSLTCLNGYFSYHSRGVSLSETMLLAENKGAFACFTASSIGDANDHGVLSKSLFSAIFKQKEYILGAATVSAKISSFFLIGDNDIVQTFTLFGDPATALKINLPPKTPENPTPNDGESGISQTPTLSWEGGDPNNSDTVVYDIYFGGSEDPELVSEGQVEITYDPGDLDLSNTYRWRVIARDSFGESSAGPEWDFTVQGDAITTSTTTTRPTPFSTTTTSGSTSTVISTSTTTVIIPLPETTTTTSSINSTTTTVTNTTTTLVQEIMCPIALTLDGKSKEIKLLRRVRDEIISRDTPGKQYVKLYYRHYIEVSLILLEDQETRDNVATLVKKLIPSIPSYLENNRLLVSREMNDEVISVLDLVERRSGPALKTDIRKVKRDLKKGNIFKQFNITLVSSK